MPKQFDHTIPSNHFTGQKNLHQNAEERENVLGALLRAIGQRFAQEDVDAASISALTDSSGGTAGVNYEEADSLAWSNNDITGFTTGVQSSALNTAADTFTAAYRELAEKINEIWDEIDPTSQMDVGPGAATDGTIDAVTVAVTANTGNTDAATWATARAVQEDLLHQQRTVIHTLDDALESVGLDRVLLLKRGEYDPPGTLTFATGPDTITRTTGSWVTDGFTVGDEVEIQGTDLNNAEGKAERRTVSDISATVLTFSGTGFSAESLSAGESALAVIKAVRSPVFPGRLAGGDPGPALTETSAGGTGSAAPAGADWTLDFLTGTSAISNAVDGADATSAVLKAEVDDTLAELANNIALLNDGIDAAIAVTAGPVGVFASR